MYVTGQHKYVTSKHWTEDLPWDREGDDKTDQVQVRVARWAVPQSIIKKWAVSGSAGL